MIVELQLSDGTRAIAWSILPGDRDELAARYEQLSPEARYHRFLAVVPHLTDDMLDHLVDDVDGVDHVALALFVLDKDNSGEPVAVGRVIRYDDDPAAADVAVTVADEWQGRGVATALLTELVRQRPAGVRRLATTIAGDNDASLAMLRRLGSTTVTNAGTNRLDVVVMLPEEPSHVQHPDVPRGDRDEGGP